MVSEAEGGGEGPGDDGLGFAAAGGGVDDGDDGARPPSVAFASSAAEADGDGAHGGDDGRRVGGRPDPKD